MDEEKQRARTCIDEFKARNRESLHSFGPVWTEPDLQQWEAQRPVRLPEAYRLLLLEVGDGSEHFNIKQLRDCECAERCGLPFPLISGADTYWEPSLVPAEHRATLEAAMDPEMKWEQVQRFDQGCLDLFPTLNGHLFLVCTGKERGQMYSANQDGGLLLEREAMDNCYRIRLL